MEIEPKGLDFSSALTQTYTNFFLVLPFLFFSECRPTLDFQAPKTHEQIKSKTNQTHSPSLEAFGAWVVEFLNCYGGETRPISTFCIAWRFCHLGLVKSVPGLLGFCIVMAVRHVQSLRFASPEAFAACIGGFLHRRGSETRPISAFCIAWSFHRLGLVRIVASLLLSSSLFISAFWTL